MKVRYNPLIGTVMLVLGAACTFLGAWLLLLGEFSPAVIAGVMPMALGVLQLVRPYFVVTPTAVVMPALFGPAKRQFPYSALAVENGRLMAVGNDGARKRVPVARWMANSRDWSAVVPR